MPLNPEERGVIAKAFEDAMPTIEAMVKVYCTRAGAPERFGLAVFDATGAGADYEQGGDVAARLIAERRITVADWGERNFIETASRKTRGALRNNRDSGDMVRNAKELFQEGDAPNPGACLGEVDGKAVCVATSGLRGTEDEPFAHLVIELMKRLTAPAA
jgi:hypothetical protein